MMLADDAAVYGRRASGILNAQNSWPLSANWDHLQPRKCDVSFQFIPLAVFYSDPYGGVHPSCESHI